MAQRLEQRGCVQGGARALGVERRLQRRERRDADPQPAGLPRGGPRERLDRRRRPRGVAGFGAGEDVEQQRRLAHGAREDAVLQEEALPGVGCRRDPPAGGLQADEAAAGGGDPQRTAAIVAVGDRDHAGRHGRGRPAGRPARRALEVPRVAGRATAPWLGDRQDPPLGQRRRPDDDEARLAQPADHAVVVLCDRVAREVGAAGQAQAADRAVVLDRDRHAGERARVTRPYRRSRRQRAFAVDVDERVDERLQFVDAAQRSLDELNRRQLAAADERGEVHRRALHEVGVPRHACGPYRRRAGASARAVVAPRTTVRALRER